jgi:hypothetical protein
MLGSGGIAAIAAVCASDISGASCALASGGIASITGTVCSSAISAISDISGISDMRVSFPAKYNGLIEDHAAFLIDGENQELAYRATLPYL